MNPIYALLLAALLPFFQDDQDDVRRQLEVVRAEMEELREVGREKSAEYKKLQEREKKLLARMRKGQETEIKRQIAELERMLKSTSEKDKRKRLQASIEDLKMKLKRLREGKAVSENEDEEDPRKRLENLNKRLKENPEDYDALHNRCEIYVWTEKPKLAEADARTMIRISAEEPAGYVLLGFALHFQNKIPESDGAFKKAVEIEPDVVEWINEFLEDHDPDRVMDMKKMGMRAGLAPSMEMGEIIEALKKNPKDVKALTARAAHHLRNDDIDKAKEDLTSALKIDSEYGPAYLQRALMHAKTGRMERAERDLQRAGRHMRDKPGLLYRAEQAIFAEMQKHNYRNRSREDLAEQINTLKERLEEVDDPAEQKKIKDEIAKLEDCMKNAPEHQEEHEDGVLDRKWRGLEKMERELRSLGKKYRKEKDDAKRKAFKKQLEEGTKKFLDERQEIWKLEIKMMKRHIENLQREIEESAEFREDILEDHIQEFLHNEEEEEEEDDEEEDD